MAALSAYFPESVRWSRPEGVMFIWAEGPGGLDMEKVYQRAVERNAAFVPGRFFYTDDNEGMATMRLNYTMADEKDIHHAVKILGEEIAKAA